MRSTFATVFDTRVLLDRNGVAESLHIHYPSTHMTDDRVVDVEGLFDALDIKRRTEKLSWRDVAALVGVSPSTLTRMAQGASPDVEGFGKMVRWLQVSADDFIARPRTLVPKPADQLMVVVSRHLRASKELDPKSAKALEAIIEAAYRQVKDLKSS